MEITYQTVNVSRIMKGPMGKMMQISRSSDTVMVYSTGPMVPTTKVSGTLTKPKGKESSGMLKEMYTRATSGMIWPTVMESILISMDPSIKESSKMMSKKAMEKKSGLMVLNILETTKMV